VFFSLHIHSSKGYSSGQYTTVRVGYFISESYQDISPDGTRSGYGYEFLQRISDYADFNYDYVDCIWSECLEKLKNGEIDLLTYAGYSPEIDKFFDYSQKIMDYGYGALLVKKDTIDFSIMILKNSIR
jgi:ABC-type amino acid transport substrate-binding protein